MNHSNVRDFSDFTVRIKSLKPSSSDFLIITDELKHISNQQESWYAVGSRLQQILNERLYRNGGYHSFSDYCVRGFGYSRQHVYKIIKVVEFIDKQWMRAENEIQRINVIRLFNIGFTKLYLLHSVSQDMLEYLLNEGVSVPVNNFYPERIITLESATTNELKRILINKQSVKQIHYTSSVNDKLPTILNTQAKSLLQLIDQCLKEIDDKDLLAGNLGLMRDYVTAILDGFNALSNNRNEGKSEGDENLLYRVATNRTWISS